MNKTLIAGSIGAVLIAGAANTQVYAADTTTEEHSKPTGWHPLQYETKTTVHEPSKPEFDAATAQAARDLKAGKPEAFQNPKDGPTATTTIATRQGVNLIIPGTDAKVGATKTEERHLPPESAAERALRENPTAAPSPSKPPMTNPISMPAAAPMTPAKGAAPAPAPQATAPAAPMTPAKPQSPPVAPQAAASRPSSSSDLHTGHAFHSEPRPITGPDRVKEVFTHTG